MSHAVRSIRVLVAGGGADALADCGDLSLARAAGDRRAVVALASEMLPDVAVVGDDPALIEAIRTCSPATNVLVLAPAVDRTRILDAIDAGAGGYLLVDDDPALLPDAVRAAARGESPLAPRAARALIAGRPLARRDGRLPGPEKRVLGLLGRGCPDEEIAERLELSPAELRRALDVVTGALGVADRTQAALWAQRHGYDGGDGDPAHREGPFTQNLGITETLGRIRVPARPAGKRSNGRLHDAHGCEDRPGTDGPGGDGADAGDRGLRR
jgi:DNA-binding NarL/FixJ family response regulator